MGNTGSSSSANTFTCDPNTFIDRVKVRQHQHDGKVLKSIQVFCSNSKERTMGGGDDRNEIANFYCKTGMNHVSAKSGKYLDSIRVKCTDGTDSGTLGGSGGGENNPPLNCPPNQVLTSITLEDFEHSFGGKVNAKCDYKINCRDKNNVLKAECGGFNNTNPSDYQQLGKEYCNESKSNANSRECTDFCNNNRTLCKLKTDLEKCLVLGIDENNCDENSIKNLESRCKRMTLLSDQGLYSQAQCTVNSLNALLDDCKANGLSEDQCTPSELTNKKLLDAQRLAVKESAESIERSRERTNNILANIAAGKAPEDTGEDGDEGGDEDASAETQKIAIIVIAVSIVLLGMSSSIILTRQA